MDQIPDLSFETTLHVRDACPCLHARRTARALARRFDVALKPAGITSGQFSLLMSLNRPQPPGLGSVATLLAVDRTTLTANHKPLARRGLGARRSWARAPRPASTPSCAAPSAPAGSGLKRS